MPLGSSLIGFKNFCMSRSVANQVFAQIFFQPIRGVCLRAALLAFRYYSKLLLDPFGLLRRILLIG